MNYDFILERYYILQLYQNSSAYPTTIFIDKSLYNQNELFRKTE
jgi:hypothetical protein